MGPDLSDIGAKRSPSNLKSSILEPNASIVPGWGTVKVSMANGPTISGVKLNEDQFAIMVREGNGKIHNIEKSMTKDIERGKGSSMPSYRGRMPDAELDDLISYLFSLRGGM